MKFVSKSIFGEKKKITWVMDKVTNLQMKSVKWLMICEQAYLQSLQTSNFHSNKGIWIVFTPTTTIWKFKAFQDFMETK